MTVEPNDVREAAEEYVHRLYEIVDSGRLSRQMLSTFEPEDPPATFEGDPVEPSRSDEPPDVVHNDPRPVHPNWSPGYEIDWERAQAEWLADIDLVRERQRVAEEMRRNTVAAIADEIHRYQSPPTEAHAAAPRGLVSTGAYEIQSTEYESSRPISVREWIEQAREVLSRSGRDLSETFRVDSLAGVATVRDSDGAERLLVPELPPARPITEPHYTMTTGIRPRRIRVAL